MFFRILFISVVMRIKFATIIYSFLSILKDSFPVVVVRTFASYIQSVIMKSVFTRHYQRTTKFTKGYTLNRINQM